MKTYMEMEEFLSKGSREVCLSGNIMLCLIIIYQPSIKNERTQFKVLEQKLQIDF